MARPANDFGEDLLQKHYQEHPHDRREFRRILLATLLLTCASCTATNASATQPTAAETPKRGLQIYFIDTEGGFDVIVTPAGESVLVDTGNPSDATPADRHRRQGWQHHGDRHAGRDALSR